MHRSAHTLVVTVGLLGAGAAATVAVAWIGDRDQPRACRITTPRPPAWPSGPPKNWPLPDHFRLTRYTWGEVREWNASSRLTVHSATEHRSGFPCRALARTQWESEVRPDPNLDEPGPLESLSKLATEEEFDRAMEAVKKARKAPDPPVREEGSAGLLAVRRGKAHEPIRTGFPLAPVWPGFAINTVVYAALLLGAYRLPGAWIRARRHDHGWCLRCGYSCAGFALCPECGESAVPPQPLTAWRRRVASVGAVGAISILVVYVTSLTGGACLKCTTGSGGWYAGVWRGHLGVARTTYPFYSPGLEVGTYDIPFRFDFVLSRSPERTECLVPLWIPLVLAGTAALGARGVLNWRTLVGR